MSASHTLDLPTAPADAASDAAAHRARQVQVPCTVEIAHTADDCYAHVVLQGIDVGPGDEVLVHDAPTRIAYGEHRLCETRATVSRASGLGRLWTRLTARFELTMLYEVSFSSARFAKSAHQPYPRRPIAPRAANAPADSNKPDALATQPRRAA